MICGILGVESAGKDSVADTLVTCRGYQKVCFADALRAMALAINPWIRRPDAERFTNEPLFERLAVIVNRLGWREAKDFYPEIREFLQRLGTEGARECLGDNVWIDALFRRHRGTDNLVIPDCRFPNEAKAIRDRGGVILRVERPGFEAVNGHVSGHAWAAIEPDGIVLNDRGLKELADETLGVYDAVAFLQGAV